MNNIKKHKFSSLYKMSSGISSKPEQAGHGAPFLSFRTVFNNYFLPSHLEDLMDTSEQEQTTYSVLKGDIFLTRTSETLDELGMSSVAIKDYPRATFSGFLKRLRPIQNDVTYDKYMAFYLRSKLFRKTMTNNAIMTLRASLNDEIFSYLNLYLPDYDIQKRSGDFLYLLNSKIELNNRINAELKQMAKTLYDYWFVQFDFPFDFAQGKPNAQGKPYKSSGGKMVWCPELKREVPEGWEVKRIDEIISVKDGTHDSPKPKSFGYRLITSKNLKVEGLDFESANFISEEDYVAINKRSRVDTGDILFSMIGNIGTVYKIEEKEINFAVKNVALYKSSEKMEYRNFIYMFLKSDDMKKYMANTISGSIQKFIGLGDLRKMPIFINDSVIAKFEETTKSIFEKQNQVKIENQNLSSLRDWLLPMLMNGQVKVGKTKAYTVGDEQLGMVAEP